ncbi:aminoglycoside phosphotransferase family protein [Paraburkholderia bannensis]|uniref:aminoglycoside phosphotransferase family protein n=1 Tax=Paraburkholderia bannensis TaxID=765414 RepID=UPI002AB71D80|nr:aminoglycoside phosphotransferase family protein [Paraburkholderia bannensis]
MRVVETPRQLETLLLQHWNVRAVQLEALSSGHTNKTYRVQEVARTAILRVSWPGKTAAQVQREEAMLRHLSVCARTPSLPRLLPTLSGESCVQAADGCWLHLFESIDGVPGMPRDALQGTTDAMRALAHLHAGMATLDAHEASPLAWLQMRHARVAAREAPRLSVDLSPHYPLLIDSMGALLAQAHAWIDGPAQWLHGDYHAGNLLFNGQALTGVIDFDDVGLGSRWLEAAFALFALSRDATVEERLVFDASVWSRGLAAYAEACGQAAPGWMHAESPALMHLFCTDQLLIHLEAAQRGLWTPGPGMGFLACWRELLRAAPIGMA